VILRDAAPTDHDSIRDVVTAAFGRVDEAGIVDRVRAASHALIELVAELDGEIVGHVLFGRMICEPASLAAGLAPLAVAPHRQGAGVGTALARHGLAACRALGAKGCVVLGAPAYYGRFGFCAAPETLRSRYAGLAAFQVLEFEPGAFAGPVSIAYPPAFD